jgi:Hg(II)-responsive transcriptional regulator
MSLTISQVATAGNVNIETIRYYERRGLLDADGRTTSGYRQYSDDAVKRLRFIKHAQELGFSLAEIHDLLTLRVTSGTSCTAVAERTRTKLATVQERIRHLHQLKRTLERLAAACAACRPTDPCPVLAALDRDDGL